MALLLPVKTLFDKNRSFAEYFVNMLILKSMSRKNTHVMAYLSISINALMAQDAYLLSSTFCYTFSNVQICRAGKDDIKSC